MRSGNVLIHDGADAPENESCVVRNRDIPTLREVPGLMWLIKTLEERREWQRERMTNITGHLTGMPGGGGRTRGLDDAFAALSEIDEAHEQACLNYTRQLKAAQKILIGISSPSMRAFVEMKYMMDTPNREIMGALNMTRRGFERARRCVEQAECMAQVRWPERYIVQEGI